MGKYVSQPDRKYKDIQDITLSAYKYYQEKLKSLGVLGYKSNTLAPSSDCMHCFPADGNIEFYATRRAKIFGQDTLVVWSVVLGENKP